MKTARKHAAVLFGRTDGFFFISFLFPFPAALFLDLGSMFTMSVACKPLLFVCPLAWFCHPISTWLVFMGRYYPRQRLLALTWAFSLQCR